MKRKINFSSNMYFIYCVSLSLPFLNILPHFSSSQVSSLNAISSCLPHNPLSSIYIVCNEKKSMKKKKSSYSICNRFGSILPSFPQQQQQQTVKIWMNFWFRSISQCTCLNFPSFFFERTFLPFSSSSSSSLSPSLYIILFCVYMSKVRKELAIINKPTQSIYGRPSEREHSYWCTRLFIEIMNLWSLRRDYIIEYERASTRKKETFANNWKKVSL